MGDPINGTDPLGLFAYFQDEMWDGSTCNNPWGCLEPGDDGYNGADDGGAQADFYTGTTISDAPASKPGFWGGLWNDVKSVFSGPAPLPSAPEVPLDPYAQAVFAQIAQDNPGGFVNLAALPTLGIPAAVAAGGAVLPAAVDLAAQSIGAYQATAGATGTVVLGSYPTYLNTAQAINANAFNLSTPLWNTLNFFGSAWTANQQFINTSVALGQQFVLSNPPGAGGNSFPLELGQLVINGIDPNALPVLGP